MEVRTPGNNPEGFFNDLNKARPSGTETETITVTDDGSLGGISFHLNEVGDTVTIRPDISLRWII